MEQQYIYTLDYDGIIFYIGKTKNIKNRFNSHKKSSKLKRNYKERFINKLLNESKEIHISILDIVEKETVNFWEKYWIEQFRQWGFKLTNTTTGGDGGDYWSGKKHSEETKKKLSDIRYKQIEKGMVYRLNGESNGRSKLTEEQVIEMRKLRNNGYSYNKLSLKYKVSKSTVVNIIKRRKWKHV